MGKHDVLGPCLRLLSLVFIAQSLACNPTQNLATVDRATKTFRDRLDSGNYGDIYAHSDAELHSAVTKDEFARVLQTVHERLGKAQTSRLIDIKQAWSTGRGRIVTAVYDTAFVGGRGTETFVWRIGEVEAVLVGYHVRSDVLDDIRG